MSTSHGTHTAPTRHAHRTRTTRAPHDTACAPQATSHIKTGAAAGMDAEDVLVGPLNSRVQFERVKVSM